jgi:hypothetical protein
MGLKMWSVVLVVSLLCILLIGFLAGFISLINLSLLVCSILILFASYLTITRKDPFTKVPTPLEIEKIKRKRKGEDSETLIGPEK